MFLGKLRALVTPGAFSFFSAAPPSVLLPVTPVHPYSFSPFYRNARRTASTDPPYDRFVSGQGRRYIAPHYAYRSAFHRALPAVYSRPPAVRLRLAARNQARRLPADGPA